MTVQPAINQTLPDKVVPYLTRDQYRCSPHTMDTQRLIRGGTQADQDAELDRLIREASAWCDNNAQQPLTAQVATELMRAPVSKDGRVSLHPRQSPIVQVNGASFGPNPSGLSALTSLSDVWVEDQLVILPLTSLVQSSGWVGPLQFGTARPGNRVYVSLTYVAGWAVTTLAQAALATDTTVTVTDPTGIIPGAQFRVQQGGAPTGTGSNQAALTNRTVVVQSVTGSVVTLTGPVGAAFAAGAAFTTLPDEVEQAAIFVTTALIKEAGSGTLTMRGGNARATLSKPKGGGEEPGPDEYTVADSILRSYRPVAP